jgi:hypothetical protein
MQDTAVTRTREWSQEPSQRIGTSARNGQGKHQVAFDRKKDA